MRPTEAWRVSWEQVRPKLVCPVDLNAYFTETAIAGKALTVLDIGPCDLPSGWVLVRDPLCYLENPLEQPYFLQAVPGTYNTEVCVIKPDDDGDCARYAAVRLRFSERAAVRFEEALIGYEDLDNLEEGEYFGFNVDAGLACICDETLHRAFGDFVQGWYAANADGNLYNDYFQARFAENYAAYPAFQREGGDWLNWVIPGTNYHLPMFQSGFGDGAYPVYWGYDQDGAVCQLVVQFIDIALAYGEEEAEENE